MKSLVMSSANVVATLEGRKTQTRRTHGLDEINANPGGWVAATHTYGAPGYTAFCNRPENRYASAKSRLNVGDLVYLKEPYLIECGAAGILPEIRADRPYRMVAREDWEDREVPHYASETMPVLAAGPGCRCKNEDGMITGWANALFMPEWASRCKVRITEVRIERLNDISDEDATAEGVTDVQACVFWLDGPQPVAAFWELWDAINRKPRKGKPNVSVAANPWVFAYTYEVEK